jgi:hypothetical protein
MLGAFPGAISAVNSPRIFRTDNRLTTLDMPDQFVVLTAAA